jgi:hypothetical protein
LHEFCLTKKGNTKDISTSKKGKIPNKIRFYNTLMSTLIVSSVDNVKKVCHRVRITLDTENELNRFLGHIKSYCISVNFTISAENVGN